MPRIPALLCVLAASATLPAQNFVTSPKGYLNTEGNTLFYLTSGAGVNRRYMTVDSTLRGMLMNIKSIAFRQDGGNAAATGGPDKVMASVSLGEVDFGRVQEELDANYVGNSRKNVFPLQEITLPDWRTIVSSPPAPFTLVFPFTSGFIYIGNRDLGWDMSLAGAPNGNRMTDRQYTGYNAATAATLGTGCHVTGQPFNFNLFAEHHNRGSSLGPFGMGLRLGAAWGPPNQSVVVGIATQDANLAIPGWCAKLRINPLLQLPLGRTGADGRVPLFFMNFPFTPTLVGAPVITQAYAADPSSPMGFALSNGTSGTFPSYTGANTGVQAAYTWADLINTPSTNFFWHSGAYIARFEY